jgi:hypothetical protein
MKERKRNPDIRLYAFDNKTHRMDVLILSAPLGASNSGMGSGS